MSPPSVWELSYWKTFHKFESFTGDWGFSLHLNFPIQNFSGLILYCFSKYWPFGNFESLFLHIDKLLHFWWILCFQVFLYSRDIFYAIFQDWEKYVYNFCFLPVEIGIFTYSFCRGWHYRRISSWLCPLPDYNLKLGFGFEIRGLICFISLFHISSRSTEYSCQH